VLAAYLARVGPDGGAKTADDGVVYGSPAQMGDQGGEGGEAIKDIRVIQVIQVLGEERKTKAKTETTYDGPAVWIARYLAKSISLEPRLLLATGAWITASYIINSWDRFPHLGVTSVIMGSGKSRLKEMLKPIVLRPRLAVSMSAAVLFRIIEMEQPTLMLDEAQWLRRQGSETSCAIHEIISAGICKSDTALRCAPPDWTPREFKVYSPKALFMSGTMDSGLEDKCIPISMKKRSRGERRLTGRCRLRVVEKEGAELQERIAAWVKDKQAQMEEVYDKLELLDIDNERTAELMLPLQAVLAVASENDHLGPDDPSQLDILADYARSLDERNRDSEKVPLELRLLRACKEIFDNAEDPRKRGPIHFMPSQKLLSKLVTERPEEPWADMGYGRALNRERLASLLRKFGIKPKRLNAANGPRGYLYGDFVDSWERYA
jgi:hypothetical protein